MKSYTPSKLLPGDAAIVREHALTRWLSRDLAQAAVDFSRNLGLLPIYSETSPDHTTRYLFWQPPAGALIEVRSGRTQDQFAKLADAKRDQPWRLLALHLSDTGLHSAVWITADHFETAKAFLAAHGVTAAESHAA